LITVGPHGTGAILSAMAVAQRHQKVLIHHTFGIPKLATYPMQFRSSGLAFEAEKVVPTRLLDALESTGRALTTIAIVTSKYPSLYFISAGARKVAAARGLKVALYLEYDSSNRDFGPIAARVKEADADLLWVGALALEGNLLLDAFQMIGYRPRGQYHLFPPPGPLLAAPGAANTPAFSTFEAHPPMTNTPPADALCKLFAERATQAGLPYPLVETAAAASLTAWLLLETAVNTAQTLEDKALAAWLKANRVDTPFGRLSFEGENNYGADHVKVKQNQNGRWVVVWPREFAAPGASVVYPAP
jgi:branched-chain amino acid transport system substrate-binding protein